MYSPSYTRKFKKALRLLQRRSKDDYGLVIETMELLIRGTVLPPRYQDHKLSGTLDDVRECHVRPDLLLLYAKEERALILHLVHVGSHSDVFGR